MSTENYKLMTTEELTQALEEKGIKAIKLAEDIGVGRSTVSNWLNEKRKIDEPTTKLLRLYFYGEIPFDVSVERDDLSKQISFTHYEWDVISILSKREGCANPKDWVVNKIRSYITCYTAAKEEEKITPITNYTAAAEKAPALNVAEEKEVYSVADEAMKELIQNGLEEDTNGTTT